MSILLTGAAGYIGSHVLVKLLDAGFDVLAVDDHSNSSPLVYERVEELVGRSFERLTLDVNDTPALLALARSRQVESCIHFAAFKAVGESGQKPLDYWRNNIGGLLSVLRVLQVVGARRFVFSSSATVYGEPSEVPLRETAQLRPTSVYGDTKLTGEKIVQSLADGPEQWQVAILRYFNPIGAHPSGLIGEAPQGVPNNLMPFVTQVAQGLRPHLSVFGTDYATPDGTCVRDYIHVQDLADGHIAALTQLQRETGSLTVNLGTGRGTSVTELVQTFERVNGVAVPRLNTSRRAGDVPSYYADVSKALSVMSWQARLGIEDMCRDAWHWQQSQSKLK